MQRYILERAGQSLVSLLVVVSLVFVLARLTGNPLDLLLDDYASEDTKARVAADLGLDQPWPTQYAIYLSKIVQGDFGRLHPLQPAGDGGSPGAGAGHAPARADQHGADPAGGPGRRRLRRREPWSLVRHGCRA